MAYPFFVPDHLVVPVPEGNLDRGLLKYLVVRGREFQSFSYKYVRESLLLQHLKATVGVHVLDNILVVCFRPSAKGESSHVLEVLRRGICLEGTCYRFFGHSDSQLKEKTCFLVNSSELEIYDSLARFVDFTKLRGAAKRAECIGVLLENFEKSLYLMENEFVVVKDVQRRKFNFSSGCGFMSLQFAIEIQMMEGLQVPPSVVQVIFRGFRGILVLRTDLNAVKIEFRESMKRFSIMDLELRQGLTSLGLLDYSRPYRNGYLNAQIAMLLADGGVSRDYLQHLQEEYYHLLDNLCTSKSRAAYYLRSTGNTSLLNKLQEFGLAYMQDDLEKLRLTELENMKRSDQVEGGRALPNSHHGWKTRLRVLVPKSRIVFGVCDPYEKLKYGECYFRPTISDEGEGEFLAADRVIVLRNPCYHPGDVRVLRITRNKPQYNHMRDCVVFPVKGPRPHTLECSGGNFDGGKFFISWDASLIPRWKTAPYDYGPNTIEHLRGRLHDHGSQPLKRLSIRVRERAQGYLPSVFGDPDNYERQIKIKVRRGLAEYFASYDTDLLCKLDAVFMKYASVWGPSCKECLYLHKCLSDLIGGVGRRYELEKSIYQYEQAYKGLGSSEPRPRPNAVQRLRIRMGWAKPEFKAGDDVWTTMEKRAREFLDQADTAKDKTLEE